MKSVEYWTGSKLINVYPLSYLLNPTEELAASIATGPQDDFFEKLDRCNEMLYEDLNIGVTPTWRWKPGSFNKIQEYLIRRLRINDKCNSISSLLQRTREYSYYLQHTAKYFAEIEAEKYILSRDGYRPDVNLGEFKEEMSSFTTKVEEQIKAVKEMSNGKVEIDVCLSDTEHARHASIYTSIIMKDLEMSVFNGNICVQKLKLEPIHIVVNMPFRKFLLHYNSKGNYRSSSIFNGRYLSLLLPNESRRANNRDSSEFSFPYIARPYLSNHRDYNPERIEYGNVCLDKYTDEIKNSFVNLNWIDMAMSLMSWAQYYSSGYSNPYNSVNMLHYGTPKSFSKEYSALYPFSSSCFNRVLRKHDAYNSAFVSDEQYDNTKSAVNMCDAIECIHRATKCAGYKMMVIRVHNFEYDEFKYLMEYFVGYLIEEQGYNSTLRRRMSDYFSFHSNAYINLEDSKLEYSMELISYLRSSRDRNRRFESILYYLLDETSYWDKDKTPEEEIDTTNLNTDQAAEVLRWATEGGL